MGLWYGRAALGNPWIFKQIIYYLENGKYLPEVSPKEKLEIILKHLNLEIEEKGEEIAVREMRKHIAWYVKGLKDSTKIREKINTIKTRNEVITCLTEYFNNI